ncbi:MAG: aminotransferase class I/II-fold pyridoxal phosphate-dependent enzyme, partial [Pseudomonadota bacterium]
MTMRDPASPANPAAPAPSTAGRADPAPAAAAPRPHGGDLAAACARFGGAEADWLDLSTGVNPVAYPFTPPPAAAWARLPGAAARARFEQAARAAYAAHPDAALAPAAGAQALIQAAPLLAEPGVAAVVSPTYNEYAAAFVAAGWRVRAAPSLDAAAGADAIVICNPNNPDGRRVAPEAVLAVAAGARLVLADESFADVAPELSVAPLLGAGRAPQVMALRSFGKFYGLAGARLGVAIGAPALIARLSERLGPWAASGPALAIGAEALADAGWAAAARARLAADAARLDGIAAAA